MSNSNSGIEMIFDHIEASAPCSLEGVACWTESQLSMSAMDFVRCIDELLRQDSIELTVDGTGIVIDLR